MYILSIFYNQFFNADNIRIKKVVQAFEEYMNIRKLYKQEQM